MTRKCQRLDELVPRLGPYFLSAPCKQEVSNWELESLVVQPCKQEVSNWEMAVRHDDELTASTMGDITVVPRNR